MKNLCKAAVFLVLGVILFCAVIQKPFINSLDRIEQAVANFYEEPKRDLDALYVGNSRVYTAWQPALGWHDYGITILTYATPNLPIAAYDYVIEETRKRQGDILFIFNLPAFNASYVKSNDIHYTVDTMPFSLKKLRLTKELIDINGADGMDTLEYYIPFIRFHSAWKELTERSFSEKADGMKNSVYYPAFLKKSTSVASEFTDDQLAEIEENALVVQPNEEELVETEVEIYDEMQAKENLRNFLDYCEKNQVKVLFINPPMTSIEKNRTEVLKEIVQERGFEIIDITDASEIGLNLKKDYYDNVHMNIHGSIKFTKYMGSLLLEKFGFENKHGQKKYRSWDRAYEKYCSVIGPYVMDFELEHALRSTKIKSVKGLTLTQYLKYVYLKWDASSKAEGYRIYRKSNRADDLSWRCIGEVDAETCVFMDEDAVLKKGKYTYTIVPFCETDEGRTFGNYSTKGTTIDIITVQSELEKTEE